MTTATAPQSPDRQTAELRFKVHGMHCAGCASTVRKAIEGVSGVSSASVSVTEGQASVEGADVDPQRVVEAVRNKGYDAEPAEEGLAPSEIRSDIELRQAHHERMWRYRAIVGLGLWAPLETLHWVGAAQGFAHTVWMQWTMLLGSTVVIAFAGWGFYRSALKAAAKRTANMDTLIALGATTAYIYSLVLFVLGLDQAMYFAEAAGLLGIVSLGHWFEARASAKAGGAVRELLELQPDQAERFDPSGEVETIPSAEVRPMDRLLVRPGARIPVDGIVLEGASAVDESIVTGESVPVEKTEGDEVVAGSMNTTGRLVVEANVDGRHTTVSRIAELVQKAQTSRTQIQRLADRVSAIFVPAVVSIALVTFLVWWLVVGDISTGVISAVTVLIISCPCALGLATPMAVMVGTGAASKRGVLIKTAEALERAVRARRVIFDKTGTLTAGEPGVIAVDPSSDDFSEEDILRLAAGVEEPSEHPVAHAIVEAARERGVAGSPVSDFRALPGRGVRGVVDGRTVEVVRDEEASCQVVVDRVRAGTITVADSLREDARQAIDDLRAFGLKVTMLTGDRRPIAERIGRELGLSPDEIVAEASPESKVEHVERVADEAIMIGDGINDAAALAKASVGVAMASGTTVAIESAQVVIPGDRVAAVPELVHLARSTVRTIKQNLFFAFVYNAAAIPVAAFGLLGTYGPLWAALAMGASDITVIGNALRLKMRIARERGGRTAR